MDADRRKAALRMIPYRLYVLTATVPDGTIAAAPVGGRSDDGVLHMHDRIERIFCSG